MRNAHLGVFFKINVVYGSDDGFQDLWFVGRDRVWRLTRRRERTMRFENVLVSDIAYALSDGSGIALTVDPRIDRPLTVDLTGPTFERSLSRLAESVDAAYRIEGGVYQIVPKETDGLADSIDYLPMIGDGPNEPIGARYAWLLDRIAKGQGAELRRWIGDSVDSAAFIATVRRYPNWKCVYFAYVGEDVEAIIAHRDGTDQERRFRDRWHWNGAEWKMVRRTPAAPSEGLRFYDASLPYVLNAFFTHHHRLVTLAPSVHGRVTVFLDACDFKTGLSKLLRASELTYRVERGRYFIMPIHQPGFSSARLR